MLLKILIIKLVYVQIAVLYSLWLSHFGDAIIRPSVRRFLLVGRKKNMGKLSWKIGFGQVFSAKAEKIPWLTALYHASANVTTTQICSLYRWEKLHLAGKKARKTQFGWAKGGKPRKKT